jgi:transcriptional regulator with PAS, ATPase and Fis domain
MKILDKILFNALKSTYYTIITDDKGLVVFLSKNYQELLNLQENDFIGKPVKDIIATSEIPRVLKTRKEEIGHLFKLNDGKTVVCNRIPIIENGILYGVISSATFYDLDEFSALNCQIEKLQKENAKYKQKITELYSKQQYSINEVIGSSPKIMEIKDTIQRFANSNLTILITGETGTGKEVFANAIHKLSNRRNENYVKINCAAIPKDLLESELFGYEPGSFSGSLKGGKIGKFELANHGTLLLDEIGEMPLALQSKLLRVLQEGELERVGGLKTIKLDVRIICCTNQNIEEQVEKGLFRRDLFYRINVIEINLPPLRNRLEDIKPLSKFFIDDINHSYGLGVTEIENEVYALFNQYDWDGNVRELQHVLERACLTAAIGSLKLEHFDFLLPRIYKKDKVMNSAPSNDYSDTSLNNITAEVEKEKIMKTLIEAKNNKTLAAKMLNIDRSSLYNKLKKYNIKI